MKFQKIDKAACQALRSEMQALLAKYGVDANLEFHVGNMKFSDAEVEIKVKAKVRGAATMSNKMLEAEAKALGLTLDERNGRQLVDYAARSYKYPFVFLNKADGKRYKCTTANAMAYFGTK